MPHILESSMSAALPREQVFAFFADAFNLERITPKQLRFRILTPAPIEMRRGARIDYRLRLLGVPFDWTSEISEWDPPHRFVDRQIRGPYRLWVHTHEFSEEADGTRIHDRVEYELPIQPIGELARPFVRRQLDHIFQHRAETIRSLLLGDDGPLRAVEL